MRRTWNRKVGLVSSVLLEGGTLVRRMKLSRETSLKSIPFYAGEAKGLKILYAISGIGKTNASHATTLMIERFSPDLIINFGVGGAYPPSGMNIGDIAVAAKEVYADEGVLMDSGFRTLDTIGIPVLKIGRRHYYNEFPMDGSLVKKAVQSAGAVAHAQSGTFATVSGCTGTRERASELYRQFQPICENMEGAAVAHLCLLHRTPCAELRGISNLVEKRDTSKWDTGLASKRCQMAVIGLLDLLAG